MAEQLTDEKYEALKAAVAAGKVVHFDGRSAMTLKELDTIIEHSKNVKWTEEQGARTMSRSIGGNPFANAGVNREVRQLRKDLDDATKLIASAISAQETPSEVGDVQSILVDTAKRMDGFTAALDTVIGQVQEFRAAIEALKQETAVRIDELAAAQASTAASVAQSEAPV